MRLMLAQSLLLLGIAMSGCLSTGCVSAMPREMTNGFEQVIKSGLDQARWDQIIASADGQVINPGFVVEAAIVYRASVRLDGVSGQLGVQSSGTGSPDGPSEAFRKDLLDDPDKFKQFMEFLNSFKDKPASESPSVPKE